MPLVCGLEGQAGSKVAANILHGLDCTFFFNATLPSPAKIMAHFYLIYLIHVSQWCFVNEKSKFWETSILNFDEMLKAESSQNILVFVASLTYWSTSSPADKKYGSTLPTN